MPFIGNQPALAFTSFAKQDFTTSATTSYTLDNPVANANELALFINFVRQEPTTAYTASGTSLTLTSATSASDDMYCVFLGKAVQTVNPPSGSVGTAQIADLAVTSGKLASGVLPANTPAWLVSLTSNQSISNATATKVNFDSVIFDTDSVYDNTTDYDVTIPTGKGGKYWLYSRCWLDAVDGETEVGTVRVYVNGSLATSPTFLAGATGSTGDGGKLYLQVSGLINLSDGDVLTIFVYHNSGASELLRGGNCSFHGYKIIE